MDAILGRTEDRAGSAFLSEYKIVGVIVVKPADDQFPGGAAVGRAEYAVDLDRYPDCVAFMRVEMDGRDAAGVDEPALGRRVEVCPDPVLAVVLGDEDLSGASAADDEVRIRRVLRNLEDVQVVHRRRDVVEAASGFAEAVQSLVGSRQQFTRPVRVRMDSPDPGLIVEAAGGR